MVEAQHASEGFYSIQLRICARNIRVNPDMQRGIFPRSRRLSYTVLSAIQKTRERPYGTGESERPGSNRRRPAWEAGIPIVSESRSPTSARSAARARGALYVSDDLRAELSSLQSLCLPIRLGAENLALQLIEKGKPYRRRRRAPGWESRPPPTTRPEPPVSRRQRSANQGRGSQRGAAHRLSRDAQASSIGATGAAESSSACEVPTPKTITAARPTHRGRASATPGRSGSPTPSPTLIAPSVVEDAARPESEYSPAAASGAQERTSQFALATAPAVASRPVPGGIHLRGRRSEGPIHGPRTEMSTPARSPWNLFRDPG